MQNETNYSEYSVTIGTDPSEYGPDCMEEEAVIIAQKLANSVRGKFHGISVRVDLRSAPVVGPKQSVCDAIGQWIDDNWVTSL